MFTEHTDPLQWIKDSHHCFHMTVMVCVDEGHGTYSVFTLLTITGEENNKLATVDSICMKE